MSRIARYGEINGDPIDRFTLGHAAFGVLMAIKEMPFWQAALVAVGWEIVENPLKDMFPEAFPHASHDTFANATFDALAMMGGWAVGKKATSG